MRSNIIGSFCWIICLSRIALAADVEYRLDMADLAAYDSPAASEPAAIRIAERSWSTPGVEESTTRPAPVPPYDWRPSVVQFKFPGEPPHWLDDALWPRTREMFYRTEIHEQVFSFNFALPNCAVPQAGLERWPSG
jgi:hypothetical protein